MNAPSTPSSASSSLPGGTSAIAPPPALGARRLHELVEAWADRTPEAIAMEEDGPQGARRLRYRELRAAVEDTARRLTAAGVRGGDRVLVVGENSIGAGVFALAASRLDAWVALVNARLSAREIDTFVAHAGARRAVFLSAVSPEAAAHAERRGAVAQDWPGPGRFALGASDEAARAEPIAESAAAQVAALVYTSGTSGDPKGVMLTHANLLFIAENSRRLRALTPADRVYGVLPISHVYGLSAVLLATLNAGAALVFVARFDPAHLARALAEGGISVLHGVPAAYAKLLEWGRRPGHRLAAPRLRVAQSGGAPLDQSLKDAFEAGLGVILHNGYGMTEAAPSIAQTRMEAPRRDCSVGPPIPGIEIRVVHPQTRACVPQGEVGELRVRGPNVMKGYYRNAEASREAVDSEGWLDTGDLVRQEPDGALFVVGRSKELIIRSGFNVYPVEVEEALNAHPEVVHSAVVGRPVPGNEEVVAFVERAPGAALSRESLMAFLRARLSPYKLPAEIVFMAALPATSSGKVLKAQLKRLALDRAALAAFRSGDRPSGEPQAGREVAVHRRDAAQVARLGMREHP